MTANLVNRGGQKHYLLLFFAVFGLGMATCIFAASRLIDYRETPVNFSDLEPGERFLINGLTREQIGSLKLGHLEQSAPPDIGIFGNHQIQYWHEEAFRDAGFEGSIFNYWFANLAIPDLLDFLRHAERLGKLPNEVIVLQITTPNNDNGQYIVDRSKELPIAVRSDTSESLVETLVAARTKLQKVFDYSTFLLGFSQSNTESRVVSVAACTGGGQASGLSKYIPSKIASALALMGAGHLFCSAENFRGALLPDGSSNSVGLPPGAVLNQNSLDQTKLALNAEDGEKIARYLGEILALAERNNKKLVVFVPQVFETERYSVVDRILNDGLQSLPASVLMDDRNNYYGREYFINYDHPGNAYFQKISAQIIARTHH